MSLFIRRRRIPFLTELTRLRGADRYPLPRFTYEMEYGEATTCVDEKAICEAEQYALGCCCVVDDFCCLGEGEDWYKPKQLRAAS